MCRDLIHCVDIVGSHLALLPSVTFHAPNTFSLRIERRGKKRKEILLRGHRESNPGTMTPEALTDPLHHGSASQLPSFAFFTLNTTSLSLCNIVSPKPQNEKLPQANQDGTNRKQTRVKLTASKPETFCFII